MTSLRRLLAFSTLLLSFACPAADWSDTEVQLLRGTRFHDNGNDIDIAKTVLTLQHASGHSLGRNFFFVDLYKSDRNDDRAAEIYGEFYTTFSGAKIAGYDGKDRFVRDLGLTLGVNYGAKNSEFRPNPKVLLAGPTLDLAVPGFAFFNVDVLAYRDSGSYKGFGGGRLCGRTDTTYQITPAWKLPFSIGGAKFSFEGFADIVGAHGSCARAILTQPQLRWDVGHHLGRPGVVHLGLEFQYWKNKFGIEGRKESFPQLLLVWKL